MKNISKKMRKMNLEELLDVIQVQQVDDEVADLNSIKGINNWFAVYDHRGIFAYFGTEEDALRFRLDYINQILNTIE